MDQLQPVSAWGLVLAGRGGPLHDRMLAIAGGLAEAGVRVGGFVQHTVTVEGERRYLAYRLGRPGRVHLARRGGSPRGDEERCCNCVLSPGGYLESLSWVESDHRAADLIIVDGVGRFEAGGRGHAAAIRHALASARSLILSVRPDQLDAIMQRFDLGQPVAVLEVDEPVAGFVAAMAAATA